MEMMCFAARKYCRGWLLLSSHTAMSGTEKQKSLMKTVFVCVSFAYLQ
jgi:hypothetical protein